MMHSVDMGDYNNYSQSDTSISLYQWINSHNESEYRNLFLNMDRTMKYIHEHGYCIQSFDPSNIEILNDSIEQIKFESLLQMPKDVLTKKELIKEDIYTSAFIQIGLYTNCLKYLKPDFLKDNFNRFAEFLPNSDVPYYSGVVQRGASIYFCEYASEKRKRDLQSLENEVEGETSFNAKKLIKNNGQAILDDETNNKINDVIYRQINNKYDAAFVSSLIFPIILIVLGLILIIFSFLLGLK